MKLYHFQLAPNWRKVRVYLAKEAARSEIHAPLEVIDGRIGHRPLVMGANPSIADCTLFAALQFGKLTDFCVDPALANITRWYADFLKRPSADA